MASINLLLCSRVCVFFFLLPLSGIYLVDLLGFFFLLLVYKILCTITIPFFFSFWILSLCGSCVCTTYFVHSTSLTVFLYLRLMPCSVHSLFSFYFRHIIVVPMIILSRLCFSSFFINTLLHRQLVYWVVFFFVVAWQKNAVLLNSHIELAGYLIVSRITYCFNVIEMFFDAIQQNTAVHSEHLLFSPSFVVSFRSVHMANRRWAMCMCVWCGAAWQISQMQ